jgi:hypothetical protein
VKRPIAPVGLHRHHVSDTNGFLLVVATGLVCAVELTVLVRCLTAGLTPFATAGVLAAFHVGYLVADRLRAMFRMPSLLLALALSCAALAATLVSLSTAFGAATALGAAGMVFNSVCQAIRRHLKRRASVSIFAKNLSKAIGMVFGGVAGPSTWALAWPVCAIPMCVLAAWATRRPEPAAARPEPSPADRGSRRSRPLLVAELLHHAHYFAYVYTFWFVAPSLIGPMSGVWFLIGWLAYFVAEYALRERRRAFSPGTMAIGHLLVAVMVLTMPHLPAFLVLTAWFVTGIGGGTAYMLGNVKPDGNRERYEDVGHVAGAAIAAATAGIAGGSAFHGGAATLVVAALLACAAAGTFLLVRHPRYLPPIEGRTS